MPTLKYIIFILLVILVSLFASKNMHTVEIHFFNGFLADTVKLPAMVLMSASFGLGFLLVWSFELIAKLKLKTQIHIKDRRIKSLENELTKHKNPTTLASTEDPNHLPNI